MPTYLTLEFQDSSHALAVEHSVRLGTEVPSCWLVGVRVVPSVANRYILQCQDCIDASAPRQSWRRIFPTPELRDAGALAHSEKTGHIGFLFKDALPK